MEILPITLLFITHFKQTKKRMKRSVVTVMVIKIKIQSRFTHKLKCMTIIIIVTIMNHKHLRVKYQVLNVYWQREAKIKNKLDIRKCISLMIKLSKNVYK